MLDNRNMLGRRVNCGWNVVADKGGKKTLAAGFRKCVVASTEPPAWWDQLTPAEQAEYLIDG